MVSLRLLSELIVKDPIEDRMDGPSDRGAKFDFIHCCCQGSEGK